MPRESASRPARSIGRSRSEQRREGSSGARPRRGARRRRVDAGAGPRRCAHGDGDAAEDRTDDPGGPIAPGRDPRAARGMGARAALRPGASTRAMTETEWELQRDDPDGAGAPAEEDGRDRHPSDDVAPAPSAPPQFHYNERLYAFGYTRSG